MYQIFFNFLVEDAIPLRLKTLAVQAIIFIVKTIMQEVERDTLI